MIRVVDLTDVSGAFFGRLMIGLGAEVIVIEPPGGDPLSRDALAFAHFRAGARSVRSANVSDASSSPRQPVSRSPRRFSVGTVV